MNIHTCTCAYIKSQVPLLNVLQLFIQLGSVADLDGIRDSLCTLHQSLQGVLMDTNKHFCQLGIICMPSIRMLHRRKKLLHSSFFV